MALKCQDKGGDGGADSMFVYLQTGIRSGSYGEKTETHSQTKRQPITSHLMEVWQGCMCVYVDGC